MRLESKNVQNVTVISFSKQLLVNKFSIHLLSFLQRAGNNSRKKRKRLFANKEKESK